MMRGLVRHKSILILIVLLVTAAVVFSWRSARGSADTEDATGAIKQAVLKSAKDCYVIEGCYPGSLDYLIENYGLSVNTGDYRIVYIPYAENLPPEVKVIAGGKN